MNLIDDFLSLFFPRTCFACGNNLFKGERVICTSCLFHLPKTNFHKDNNNPVKKVFWGRVKIESAAAYFFYRKGGKVQQLIHQMKYRGQKEIGIFLGESYGIELNNAPGFSEIDKIIPIPLHHKKLKKRGFNQAELFAIGLAKTMNKEVDTTSVVRNVATSTQTKKTRYKRWENVSDIFVIKEIESLKGKNVLIVDDVITTGATMEACVQCLQKVPEIKISVASIAFASG
ncbi:MAG: amidophosphoribosyltransferase [Bacteroidetes bacterium 4484_249]|nr:MAG: amidophosphoribosyltransferase [Bacteroidetes bacterium 4484_249]